MRYFLIYLTFAIKDSNNYNFNFNTNKLKIQEC